MDNYAIFSNGDIVRVESEQLGDIVNVAANNELKKRYRVCLHDSPNNKLQDMLICMIKDDYARPHKHYNMPESHFVVSGRAIAVFFDDNGGIVDAFVLDSNNGCLVYRVNSDLYHMTLVLSDSFIEYEVKPGPFNPSNNIFPQWAPDGRDKIEVRKFLQSIRTDVEKYLCKEVDNL